jgi:hypothetical protein
MESGVKNRNLPSLIIAGVNKGGTTSLFSYLSEHPEICASSVKETCFFLPLLYGDKAPSIEEYEGYFAHYKGEKHVMEATPGYIYGGSEIARTIDREIENVRILIMLRNPIDRLISFYKSKKSRMELDQNLSFDEYIELCRKMSGERREKRNNRYWGVEGGFYVDYLNEWWAVFGDRLRIFFFDQLKQSPMSLLKDVCEWMQIDPDVFDPENLRVENKTMGFRSGMLHRLALFANLQGEKFFRTHPRSKELIRRGYYALNGASFPEIISRETLNRLEAFYLPYNKRLTEELLKRGYSELPKWLC